MQKFTFLSLTLYLKSNYHLSFLVSCVKNLDKGVNSRDRNYGL